MKKAAVLACIACFALVFMAMLTVRAAEEGTGEGELYECSSDKTIFQNLRDWFGIWGKGLFKSKEESDEPEGQKAQDKKQSKR